jgi:hypothetical protein
MNPPEKWPSKQCQIEFEAWWWTPGIGCGEEPSAMVIWAFIHAWNMKELEERKKL